MKRYTLFFIVTMIALDVNYLSAQTDSLAIINSLEARCKDLQNNYNKATEALLNKDEDIRKMKGELEEFKSKVDKLEKSKNENKIENKALVDELDKVKADLKTKTEKCNQLSNEKKLQSDQIKEDSVKLLVLKNNEKTLNENLSRKEGDLQNKTNELNQALQDKRNLESKNAEKEGKITGLEAELKQCKDNEPEQKQFIDNHITKELVKVSNFLKEQDPLAPDVMSNITRFEVELNSLKKLSNTSTLVQKAKELNAFKDAVGKLIDANATFNVHYNAQEVQRHLRDLKSANHQQFSNNKMTLAVSQTTTKLEKYCKCYNEMFGIFNIWGTNPDYKPQYVQDDIRSDVRDKIVDGMRVSDYPFIKQEIEKRYNNPGEKRNPFQRVTCK